MSVTIALLSSDTEYMKRMLSYMKGNPIYHTWIIQLYTTPDRINKIGELDKTSLILVEESMLPLLISRVEAGGRCINQQEHAMSFGAISVVVLVAERREQRAYEIYKYQSISALLHQLLQCYERNQDRSIRNHYEKSIQTLAFSSAIEQTGKTTLAIHVAAMLASRGFSVFYCNFETWNTSEHYLSQTPSPSASSYSDFLYYVKSSNHYKQTAKWLTEHAILESVYQFYILRAFHHEEDRRHLTSEDAISLISSLSESGLYQYIIIDMPAGLDSWTIPVLAKCDLNYSVMLSCFDWLRKHELAFGQAIQSNVEGMEIVNKKTIQVLNKYNGQDTQHELHHYDERLPYVEEWQITGTILFSSSIYRASIEKLIRCLLGSGAKVG